jgi:hypothetical protein
VRQRGIALLEVSMAMGLAVFLALVVMRATMLALSNNQWTIMQTLTDAYLTGETALMVRLPLADVVAGGADHWPDINSDDPAFTIQTEEIGKMAGRRAVFGTITRFREEETPPDSADTGLTVWRLHSVIAYQVGGQQYIKSRSTVRIQ